MIASRLVTSVVRDWWHQIDRVVFFTASALLAIGFVISLAASPAAASRLDIDDPFYFFWRQGVFALVGFAIIAGVSSLGVFGVRRMAAILFLVSLVLMVLVLVTGSEVKGARRWFSFGLFTLQPIEMLKPCVVIVLAALFAKPPKLFGEDAGSPMIGAICGFGVIALCGALLLAQPDFGQTMVLFAVYLLLFLLAGMPIGWFWGLGALAAFGGVVAYSLFPHVQTRVDSFLNPAPGEGYQIQKALQAIGHGGLFGRGPGEGAVKMRLPDPHTDFAFSVAGEEFGFIALLGLILLFAALSMRGLSMARRLNDPFAQFAAAGLYSLLALEAGLNIAVNLAMVPPKGLALPFISYGGSSMIGVALSIGFALALTRRRPGAYERGAFRKGPTRRQVPS